MSELSKHKLLYSCNIISRYLSGLLLALSCCVFLPEITIQELDVQSTEKTWSFPTITQALMSTFNKISIVGPVEAERLINPMIREFLVPVGSHPHDVAPAPDGTIWYTAQGSGELGQIDPITGKTHHIKLGRDSAPHGVIVGPDGAPWVTDGGLSAIIRVDPQTEEIRLFSLPAGDSSANLNTATLTFTVFYGLLDRVVFMVAWIQLVDTSRSSTLLKDKDHMVLRQHLMVAFTMLH